MKDAFDAPFLGMTAEALRKQIAKELGGRQRTGKFSRPEAPPTSAASANMLHCLATGMHRQRLFDQAESLYKQAIALVDQPGEYHFRLSAYLYNLAGLYSQTERYQEAQSLLVRSLAISEESLGAAHPKTMRRRAALLKLRNRMEKIGGAKNGRGEPDHITY